MDDLEKQITERFAEVPPDIQAAIQAADLDSKIQTIAKNRGLHIDQTGKLMDEALMVMLALTDANSFPKRLTETLGVPMDIAELLAGDIDREIFLAIRQSLQNFSQKKAAETPMPIKQLPDPHPAELMLTQSTVTISPALAATMSVPEKSQPPKPVDYKADPYREPIE